MKRLLAFFVLLFAVTLNAAPPDAEELARWKRTARNVEIVRDDWGIAHVHGKTDAEAVFGMTYAQAEDDFNRVEHNYLLSMGRLAEAEGEAEIYRDLRAKLFIDPEEMKALYAKSPQWLRSLMDAWADALNFYLHTHPTVKPRVLTRFEPWMALTFSEGSISGDIERVNLRELEAFYGGTPAPKTAEMPVYREPRGSNGVAIAPSNSATKHALLLINPHTSFFFRSELQMTSDEGLNAYGAVTWGQFFVYQGFNERAGWMHTTSGVDSIDEYLETIAERGSGYVYRYGSEDRPIERKLVVVHYKTPAGIARKIFNVYRTHHGPLVRREGAKWVSVKLMNDPMNALMQSYSRTKATDYASFRKTMELHTNSSNNTIFADARGNIAYFHSNFIPRRDPQLDWTKPVDGSNPATEWRDLHSVEESPHLLNPSVGWLYNANNWPWSAAGPDSPKRDDFARYVERGAAESPRGHHALMVLPNKKDFTIDSLLAAAYDSYLPAFDALLPPLFEAWDAEPAAGALKSSTAEQIDVLRKWDRRWSVASVPTSLAIFWAEDLASRVSAEARAAGVAADDYAVTRATAVHRLQSLADAAGKLARDFGSWKTPWGEINRFQRIAATIAPKFDDTKASVPVGFTSARWGSLASFGSRPYPNTKRWYGTSGNSFVAVVEFGTRVRARAVSAGGESGDPTSPHFNDQAERYATGDLRDVYFYPEQLKVYTRRRYRPGE